MTDKELINGALLRLDLVEGGQKELETLIREMQIPDRNKNEILIALKPAIDFGLLEIQGNDIKITSAGKRVMNKHGSYFDYVNYIDLRNKISSIKEEVTTPITRESKEYAKKVRLQFDEINDLTLENLKLQNKDFKRKIPYAIIGFIGGVVLSLIPILINTILSASQSKHKEVIELQVAIPQLKIDTTYTIVEDSVKAKN